MINHNLLLGILFYIFPIISPSPANQLTVTISGFKDTGGDVYIGIYDNQDDFLDDDKLFDRGRVHVGEDGEVVSYTFNDIPEGTYAVALYYDVNGDRKCNRVMGLPTEGYGFSNNVRGYPSYEKVKFYFDGGNQEIEIELLYWFG